MSHFIPFEDIEGLKIFFVGIKGTGMAALAEILHQRGAVITGSDVNDKFYTDEILNRLGITYFENFNVENLSDDIQLVIHSAAYSREYHPQLLTAIKKNIPVVEYTEVLGALSRNVFSCGISGVHGKTTTTALTGTLLKELNLSVTVLAGSGVSNFSGSSVLVNGENYFVAETCEYRRHFLHFFPDVVVITSIEPDHLDYFMDFEDILDAFVSYGLRLPVQGRLIYCADDIGAVRAVKKIREIRSDIRFIGYGEKAEGSYRLTSYMSSGGRNTFSLEGFNEEFSVRMPGYHLVMDAVAALAVTVTFLEEEGIGVTPEIIRSLQKGLEGFRGSKRRSEIIGEWNNILVMDDYGHHPTEIKTTLKGLREFYPGRRIIVDFMSHTYSRTELLLDEFSEAFYEADLLILHKIYASAREKKGKITGKTLYERVKMRRPGVFYFEEVLDAFPFCREQLKPGDLFITIGAGDNWILGDKVTAFLKKENSL